jgi:catechol 2,3-dioxygenase-like lactoylglutathione lyase family enzyme
MSGPETHISGVGRVIVPVSDQDRALDFYIRTLGMEMRADVPAADGDRWR